MAMMNYERDSKRSLGRRMSVPLFIVLLVIVLYSAGPGLLHLSLRAILSGVSPALKGATTLAEGRGGFLAFLTSKESLVEENASLRKQASNLTLVRAENERLRAQLTTFESASAAVAPTSLLATVIAAPPHSVYDTLLIDVSHIQNVRQGMLVLSLDGAALGKVSEVFGGTAKVLLFSSSGVQTPATLGASTTAIDLVGRGGGTFRTTVPSRVHVKVGDWISSPALGGHIVALVEAVTTDASQLSSTIDSRSPISLTTLNSVVISNASTLRP